MDEARQAYGEIQQKYGNMSDSDIKSHIDAFLSQLHSFSWFSIGGLEDIIHSKSGTLAGASLADLVFSRCVSRVLVDIRTELRAKGLIHKFPLMGILHVLGLQTGVDIGAPSDVLADASYADDC